MPFAKNTFKLLKWLSGFTIWQNQEIGMVVKYKLAVGETQKWYMYQVLCILLDFLFIDRESGRNSILAQITYSIYFSEKIFLLWKYLHSICLLQTFCKLFRSLHNIKIVVHLIFLFCYCGRSSSGQWVMMMSLTMYLPKYLFLLLKD